jgi:hypothetical protein
MDVYVHEIQCLEGEPCQRFSEHTQFQVNLKNQMMSVWQSTRIAHSELRAERGTVAVLGTIWQQSNIPPTGQMTKVYLASRVLVPQVLPRLVPVNALETHPNVIVVHQILPDIRVGQAFLGN